VFSLVRAILWEEHWAQCLFCRRVLPKHAWVDSPEWLGAKNHEAIEKSGLCTFCQQHYPATVKQPATVLTL
jgi:hypothetical protein